MLKIILVALSALMVMAAPAFPASFEDAQAAARRGDYSIWKSLAEQGDVTAQRLLGGMYRFGWGVPQDYREAAKWYRMGADQGDVVAQFSLAEMYFEGSGYPKIIKRQQSGMRGLHIKAMPAPNLLWRICTAEAWAYYKMTLWWRVISAWLLSRTKLSPNSTSV